MKTTASPKAPLPVPSDDGLEERSRRARTEPMSVRALGEGLYEVESATDQTYLVDLEGGRCTCPDHVFRGVRCKHVRRVAIEINEGRTPPPGERAVGCHDCGKTVFVDENATGPAYCDRHALRSGDTVVDRETGDRLTVVDVSDLRADAVRIQATGDSVADYPTNENYAPDVPVVGAVYPHATVAPNGVVPESLRVYVFPRTRLKKHVPEWNHAATA
ncbi:SWIM zinc finger domain-containing protein [Natronococcus sp. A-GB1]|uniref:SWIM zinc finger family protein n=1 Tax=Natronococcus sp. A-GB1 TaxID=3037648 RepID=UPI0024202C8E|nr:SWIM zinc finger family protein [Natronococcus sp. A-GB1]MDG5758486.1 SWIM zinc finger domain-containing protein [Natronococcus sp. A-GB1]